MIFYFILEIKDFYKKYVIYENDEFTVLKYYMFTALPFNPENN